jgi:hypothetical protein
MLYYKDTKLRKRREKESIVRGGVNKCLKRTKGASSKRANSRKVEYRRMRQVIAGAITITNKC